MFLEKQTIKLRVSTTNLELYAHHYARLILWTFINCLKKEECVNNITIEKLITGNIPPKKK